MPVARYSAAALYRIAGRPLTAGPQTPSGARRGELRGQGGPTTSISVVENEEIRFPPNALRFCCRGVRRSRASPSRIYSRGCAAPTPRSAASAG